MKNSQEMIGKFFEEANTPQLIYEAFEKAGCLTFTTLDSDGTPVSRIAHFFAADDKGLYLRTMDVKPFYRQLKEQCKLSACGMSASAEVVHGDDGLPRFAPGYTIRVVGDTEEVELSYFEEMGKADKDFQLGYLDALRYPNMRFFRLFKGVGEIYDYDFECAYRDHKLLRKSFEFGGAKQKKLGIEINKNCKKCGVCLQKCTFKAISINDGQYSIDKNKCDACGSCFHFCKFGAIDVFK